MKKAAFGLYILMTIILAVATFIEKYNGTPFASEYIYGNIWFVSLWSAIMVSSLWYIIAKKKMHKQKAAFLLHLSFGIILLGAALTYFTGEQGVIHLRQNEPINYFLEESSQANKTLPFTLALDSFHIKYYPGTQTPADYISEIHVENKQIGGRVSMNHIFSHKGYRFYQTSFDEDYLGTWLSVNHDPWGIPVTYCGYILLAISMIYVLLSPQSGFRKLLRHPVFKRAVPLLFLLCYPFIMEAQNVLTKEEANKYKGKQVIYHDRVTPLNTLARDFVIKLTGKSQYKDYTPEQVITGFLFYPEHWQNEPVIKVKSKGLRQLLNINEYACLTDFFTEQKEYRLQEYWNKLHQSGKQSELLKAINEVDEKIALIVMLREGTLIKAVPDEGVKRLSNREIQLELIYNKIPFSSILFKVNLTLGLLSLLLFGARIKNNRLKCNINTTIFCLLLLSFLFHTTGMVLRTYIGGRFPLSNGYETMQFTAWCTLLIALICHRRFPLIMPFGFLLSGFTLLVASLGQMNPQITPLIPVLSSPLLSFHVSFIMISYALFGFMFLNGVIALFLIIPKKSSATQSDQQIERLTVFSRMLLYPATFFLGIGIFIGAIWANVSWGRYWAWDPKEVWALITFMIYGLALHMQSLQIFRKPIFIHIYLILAFATVLMTYFGVNYFLGGMHSYGG